MTDNTCFHCGRHLSECSDDNDEAGCNYCSILTNLLHETQPQSQDKSSALDITMIVVSIVILLFIALAIIAYNWRSETMTVAYDMKQKVGSYLYFVCF